MTYQIQTTQTIHCNRCDRPFPASKPMRRDGFCGTKVARLSEFSTCPHCQQTDCHWLYAADVMPKFEGNFDGRKLAQMQWLQIN